MSALRYSVPGGIPALLDPYTRTCHVPECLGSEPSGPVVARKATPEELARLAAPARREKTTIAIAPRRTAEERERQSTKPCQGLSDWIVCETLRSTGGNVTEAARLLDVPQSTLHRRVAWMRSARRFPADVLAALDGKRPRPSRRVRA